jgi:hypothetical protein
MGRYIYADEVGINKNNTTVHKFWLAVQPSDVSEYLDMYEPSYFLADLMVENEADIQAKVNDLKAEFEKTHGFSYANYIDGEESSICADQTTQEGKEIHDKQELASRINLGEHLLETIENMKAAGISEQQLTIEC